MNQSADEAATPREQASEPTDLKDLKERFAYIGSRAWRELKLSSRAAWAQIKRFVGFARGWWKIRRLDRKYLAAQIALGKQLEAAGLGDAALRTRLADLGERRQSFVAARESTRSIDAEQRGLYVRLAEPFLESVQSPPAAEQQHQKALALRMDIADRRASQTERRASLWAADSDTRTRTAIGLGGLALLLCLLFSTFFGSDEASGPLLPPAIELESLQPLPSFPYSADATTSENGKQVEDREFDLEADDILPARKVKVRFVNGKPEGEVRSVDAQGRLICSETFRNGLLNGRRERFYPSGEKFSQLRFVDGVAQGDEVIWFPSGDPASKTDIVDGLRHGNSIEYFENGRKCVTTTYVQGRLQGLRSHYRPDDVCFAIVDWRDGEPISQTFTGFECTSSDVEEIEDRGEFSRRLVDHWLE